ncbi:MAG TPA: ABC transporter permease [Terriglobia bacterium]|nr:ABC transporter permease [Terriglobia bacterium]
MMHRISTIALHTFKQSVRDKVLYNLVVFALLLTAASILFGEISIGIQQIILVNLGLSAIAIFGLLISIFIGISLVSREIERKTLYNVLSKSVARWEFILGKYLGLFLTLLVNTAIMTAGFYLALFYQSPRLQRVDLGSLEAIYFILLELALVIGVALLFSCISSPALAALFTFCVFVIGNLLEDIRWFGHVSGNVVTTHLTWILYYLLPDFGDFNIISRVAHGNLVSGRLLLSTSLYALLYAAILISASIMIFEEREFQ